MKKGRYIVLIIILICYLLIMFFTVGKDNLIKKNRTTKIIVGDDTVWELSKNTWYFLNTNIDRKNLNWQEFNVYVSNEKIGKYYLWYNDNWYLFNKNKEAINYEGELLAYQSNYDIEIKNFEAIPITDYTHVRKVLSENNLELDSELTQSLVVDIDFDNDNVEEHFYVISNVFSLDTTPSKVFSIVFMVKEEKIYMLYNSIEENKGLNGCKPYINYILDVDNDNENELILSCGRYSNQPPIDMLYKFKDDKFDIIISNR